MIYYSQVTDKGNGSYSLLSQEEADSRAKALDDNGCVNCVYCTDCTGCTDCVYCTGCTDCTGCEYYTDCEYC